jgi:hypothetical protein
MCGLAALLGILVFAFPAGLAAAEEIGGVEFPLGELSFADRVVSYTAGTDVESPHNEPTRALGLPDYPNPEEQTALGNATAECQAELVLEFRDNFLIDVEGPDLWIFEIGPAVEATEVFITYGEEPWTRIGRIEGAIRGVDIHGFVDPGEKFTRVRLCDWPGNQTSMAPYGGPDIDAVGAIGAGLRPDSDGDELRDDEELLFFTDPLNPDTDGDGVDDGTEVANQTDPRTPEEIAAVPNEPTAAPGTGEKGQGSAETPTDATTALAGLTAAAAAILIAAAMVQSNTSASTRPPREILDGPAAIRHLIDGGADTIEIDDRDYLLPPGQLPGNTAGVAYETMEVGGIDVIDPDKIAIVTEPAEPPVRVPEPDLAAGDVPGPVRITEDEIEHIVDWGIRHQRPLADIQRDIDSRNETLGGSGRVPIPDPPREVDLEYGGTVVLDAAEAQEYESLRDQLDLHRAAALAWGETLRVLSGRSVAVAEAHSTVVGRFVAGLDQLLGEVNRYKAAPDEIGARYGRPTWSDYDAGKYRTLAEAVEAWEQSPRGRQALEEIDRVQVECIENMQSMTSDDPTGRTSWFNCTAQELDEIERTQERYTQELRYLRHRTADFREMERRLAERIGRE